MPEGSNGRWKVNVTLGDILKALGMIGTAVALIIAVDRRITTVEAWGKPPDGQLVVLRDRIDRHVNFDEEQQEAERKIDHDTLTRLEAQIKEVTKQMEEQLRVQREQNKLQERLLDLLEKKVPGPTR